MAENRSDNKLNVCQFFGGSAVLGRCDPLVAMTTDQGKILSLDSGNGTVVLGLGTGDFAQRFYTSSLFVTSGNAAQYVAWPTGVGCVPAGHVRGMLLNGSPVLNNSGVSYEGGDGTVHSFGRD